MAEWLCLRRSNRCLHALFAQTEKGVHVERKGPPKLGDARVQPRIRGRSRRSPAGAHLGVDDDGQRANDERFSTDLDVEEA